MKKKKKKKKKTVAFLFCLVYVHLANIDVFAKFDEISSLPFQDIKEKSKRSGQNVADGKTDGRTDG